MENSTAPHAHLDALFAHLSELVTHLEVGEESLTEPLKALVSDLKAAVGSFIGVQLIMVVDGHPVRLSLFEPAASDGSAGQPITTSLQLPLGALASGSPAGGPPDSSVNGPAGTWTSDDSTITFYAGTPGAFVDLAADLDYALKASGPGKVQPDRRVSVDQHLVPVSLVSGLFGLAELSVISMAVGVLIDRGHLLEDAPGELRRRAVVDGVSPHTYAVGFLRRLTSEP